MSHGTSSPQHKRADIQGMRAVAVLAVLAFHADRAILPGGFAGVDVFFVLSGYLITQVLLRPMEEGRFSIADFYRRRMRRLFPALFVVLAFSLVMGLILFPPTLLVSLVKSAFFTTLFLSNFAFARETGYFDIQAELKPLLHTWSLGVEEQFYLLFPPILFALYRWARPFLWIALLGAAALSLYFSETRLSAHSPISFYFPTSRAFELLIGALCVGLQRRVKLSGAVQTVLGLAGLIALALSFTLIHENSRFPGLLALAPCLGAACLVLSPEGQANRLLKTPWLVWVGDISYSLYLWHWVLLVFARFVFPDSPWAAPVAIALSVLIARASYLYIEKPFLTDRPRPVFALGGGAMAASIALCLPVYLLDGLPQRFSKQEQQYLAATDDYSPGRKKCHMRSDRPIAYDKTCIYGSPDAAPSYAIWGDSHGVELAVRLGEKLSDKGKSVRSITMSGCPATLTRRAICREHNIATMAAIKADPNMRTILLVQNLHGDGAFARNAVAGIERSALELQKAGKRPVIVFPIPTFDYDPPSKMMLETRMGRAPESVGMPHAIYQSRRRYILDELERFTKAHGIAAIRPDAVLCDSLCRIYKEGAGVLYYNPGHLSLTGAGVLADEIVARLEPDLAAALAKTPPQ